jgi:hypothetical protein
LDRISCGHRPCNEEPTVRKRLRDRQSWQDRHCPRPV